MRKCLLVITIASIISGCGEDKVVQQQPIQAPQVQYVQPQVQQAPAQPVIVNNTAPASSGGNDGFVSGAIAGAGAAVLLNAMSQPQQQVIHHYEQPSYGGYSGRTQKVTNVKNITITKVYQQSKPKSQPKPLTIKRIINKPTR